MAKRHALIQSQLPFQPDATALMEWALPIRWSTKQ
jgi:hypothetical protein